jgi:3-hydroxyacyl-[acyl-carrier-protein] dehydratase
MLTGELFQIQETTILKENEYSILFRCNAAHAVFKGHFPNNPVLPGVCMVQFVRESLEVVFNKKLQLVQSKSIKFINIVNPEKENLLQLILLVTSFENELLDVSATIKSETTSFFQYKGRYNCV